jgi:uncharacterized membrane protein
VVVLAVVTLPHQLQRHNQVDLVVGMVVIMLPVLLQPEFLDKEMLDLHRLQVEVVEVVEEHLLLVDLQVGKVGQVRHPQ